MGVGERDWKEETYTKASLTATTKTFPAPLVLACSIYPGMWESEQVGPSKCQYRSSFKSFDSFDNYWDGEELRSDILKAAGTPIIRPLPDPNS